MVAGRAVPEVAVAAVLVRRVALPQAERAGKVVVLADSAAAGAPEIWLR